MHIARIELFHVSIPCLQPFETSFGKITQRPALIIRMESNTGVIGVGESSPLDVPISEPEVTATALPLLRKILPELIGIPVDSQMQIHEKYTQYAAPVSLIGIEAAYLDLVARSEERSMRNYLGVQSTSITLGESVSLYETVDDVLTNVTRYVEQGVTRIKLKIAPGRDVQVVRAVRAAFPLLSLGADANAAYTSTDIDTLSSLTEYNLAFIEQPFGLNDLSSHTALRNLGVRIALDESVYDTTSAKAAIAHEACDLINIKPARIGSFAESRVIHDLAITHGIGLFGGGRLETSIGKTMNANFYGLPGFTDPSDITAPSDYLESDIAVPLFLTENASYNLTDTPGLGIDIDRTQMNRYLQSYDLFENRQ